VSFDALSPVPWREEKGVKIEKRFPALVDHGKVISTFRLFGF